MGIKSPTPSCSLCPAMSGWGRGVGGGGGGIWTKSQSEQIYFPAWLPVRYDRGWGGGCKREVTSGSQKLNFYLSRCFRSNNVPKSVHAKILCLPGSWLQDALVLSSVFLTVFPHDPQHLQLDLVHRFFQVVTRIFRPGQGNPIFPPSKYTLPT